MAEGKKRITTEKKLANLVFRSSPSVLYGIRRGYSKDVDRLKNTLNDIHGIKVDNLEVKPQVNRDRGEPANTLLDDAFPEKDAIITITVDGQKFSFALPPLAKEYSSRLRRPETKREKGSQKQRDKDQYKFFDRKEDA